MPAHMATFAINHITAPELDIEAFFALARSLDLHHVEIRNDIEGQALLDGTSPEAIRSAAQAAGVTILSINALQRFNEWTPQRANEAEALADYAERCGAQALVLVPVNDGTGRANGERQGNLRNSLRELAPILSAHKLTGLVEPLGFEICSLRSKKEAVEAISALNLSDRFKLVHDTFHHFLAGEPDMFPTQTGLVHISGVTDSTIGVSAMLDAHRVLVDEADRLGNLSQLTTLFASNYLGPISFEPFSSSVQKDPDLHENLSASIHFINRHLAAE